MYRERHGKSPLKCTEMIGGMPKEVNAYTEADRALMEASRMEPHGAAWSRMEPHG